MSDVEPPGGGGAGEVSRVTGPVLDAAEVYRRLEAQLARAGWPAVHAWNPPHPDPQQRILQELPAVTVPTDLIAWWGWHDGADRDPDRAEVPKVRHPGVREVSGGHWPLPLEAALETRAVMVDASHSARVDEPEELWNPHWLPITQPLGGGCTVVDLSSSDGVHADVLWYEPGIFRTDMREYRESRRWAEVVSWWVRLLEDGVQYWDDRLGWCYHRDRVPPDLIDKSLAFDQP